MLQNRKPRAQRRVPLSTRRMVTASAGELYGATLQVLVDDGVPFVVGGAFALKHYAGVARGTKDLDVFLKRSDLPRAREALEASGFETEETFPHWLAKAFCPPHFVDMIHNSANGLCPVDDAWIERAPLISIFGVPALLCPPEELIWSKAFVMERERYDGADIHHVLATVGDRLDWRHLVDRFAEHWRVLYAHLTLFGYAFPRERGNVPAWVLDELAERLDEDRVPEATSLCRGTFLSREQYIVDTAERGYDDARVAPAGPVDPDELVPWTAAIAKPH